MTKKQQNRVVRRLYSLLAGALALTFLANAYGDSVTQMMTGKTLPQSTIEVIDPEGGSSSGGDSSEVNLAVGDVISFRFDFVPVPDRAVNSVQAYLTEYVPESLEVVGVRIVEAVDHDSDSDTPDEYWTVKPFRPGVALDNTDGGTGTFEVGSGIGLNCSSGSGCSGGEVSPNEGSVAAVSAETGVFFYNPQSGPTDEMDRVPGDSFISLLVGALMDPEPTLQNKVAELLGLATNDPRYAHNQWDWRHAVAFGVSWGGNSPNRAATSQGAAPTGYGSPVAGEHSLYQYQVDGLADMSGSDSHDLEYNDTVGPWTRLRHWGSRIGDATQVQQDDANRRVDKDALIDTDCPGLGGSGTCSNADDVSPNNPINTAAVRFALGEGRPGFQRSVEVAFRVKSSFTGTSPSGFFDKLFSVGDAGALPDQTQTISGGNVNCGEIFGGDSANTTDGNDTPWPHYLAAPGCTFLRYFLAVTADDDLLETPQFVNYTVDLRNLSLLDDAGAILYLAFDSNTPDPAPTGETPAFDSPSTVTCPFDPGRDCLKWTLGAFDSGDELTYTVQHEITSNSKATQLKAVYISDNLGSGTNNERWLENSTAVTNLPVPVLRADLGWDGSGNITQGGTADFSGTVENDGTGSTTVDQVVLQLPSGWTVTDTGGAATVDIFFNGTREECDADCGTANPVFDLSTSMAVGASVTWSFTADASGADDTLETLGLQIFASSGSDKYERFFPELVTVPVGQDRTAKPVITCPVNTSAADGVGGTIDGTSESGAAVDLYFNMLKRGDISASGTDWSVPNADWQTTYDHGDLYGGLELRATATATGKLESELSDPCFVTATRACSDGIDNDGDGFVDFPNDQGCDSPTDTDEDGGAAETTPWQCVDSIDNAPTNSDIDWPEDLTCYGPDDDDEGDVNTCADTFDNDGDGFIDCETGNWDPDCACSADDTPTKGSERTYFQCQDGIDNDGDCAGDDSNGDGIACNCVDTDADRILECDFGVDFPTDPGCHTAFDNDETDPGPEPTIKGRVLIVFDTSGSMNLNTCTGDSGTNQSQFLGGDGSYECLDGDSDQDCSVCCDDFADGECIIDQEQGTCGNTFPDDSRLFKVKDGISDAIASFGDVEYGLMRFSQRPEEFACPGSNLSFQSGGWQGGGVSPCVPFEDGELVVGFSRDNASSMLRWMDGASNYDADPDVLPPYGLDWELRGSGTTPLGGSLSTAKEYMDDLRGDGDAIADNYPDDDKVDCRPYRVILVTDGLETCDYSMTDGKTAPERAAEALYNSGTVGDTVPVTVIAFATPASDPDGIRAQLDKIAAAGGTTDAKIASDEAELSAAIAQIVEDAIVTEVCNGIDDDCDGEIDEGFNIGGDCSIDNPGELCDKPGVIACLDETSTVCEFPCEDDSSCPPLPGDDPELCDPPFGDEDCDGFVDEGCENCVPEVCDGADNNCNCINDDTNGNGIDCDCADTTCYDGVNNDSAGGTDCEAGNYQASCNCTGDDTPGAGATEGPSPIIVCDDGVDEGIYPPAGPGELSCGVYPNVGECSTGYLACIDGQDECVGEQGPNPEICDGLDNDCDGNTDDITLECFDENSYTGFCQDAASPYDCCPINPSTGLMECNGQCRAGSQDCLESGEGGYPGPDVCTGFEGPETETCDGEDNDCDGSTDEGFGVGNSCTIGQSICTSSGVLVCDGSGGVVCNATPIPPLPGELCNGIDDDCDCADDDSNGDGITCNCAEFSCRDGVDNDSAGGTDCQPGNYDAGCNCTGDNAPGVGGVEGPDSIILCDDNVDEDIGDLGSCGNDSCGTGTFICQGGTVICDVVGGGGSQEICDGDDNDCNGFTDEIFPEEGGTCFDTNVCDPDDFGTQAYNDCVADASMGTCSPGIFICTNGGLECDGFQGPQEEVCDGLDNDCDGNADDNATCPASGNACVEGSCVSPCGQGEFPCPFGEFCNEIDVGNGPEDFCVADPCVSLTCPDGEFCDSGEGTCIDYCDGIECPTGKLCNNGFCVDCFTLGCPDGEICTAGEDGIGSCSVDLCADVVCEANEFCSGGECMATSCDPTCGEDERCVAGQCVADACSENSCADGQVCNPEDGSCILDPCRNVTCDAGEACHPVQGVCIADPCLGVECAEGTQCDLTLEGAAICQAPEGEYVFAGGSGGCSVSGDDSGPMGGWLLLGVALFFYRRRRRS